MKMFILYIDSFISYVLSSYNTVWVRDIESFDAKKHNLDLNLTDNITLKKFSDFQRVNFKDAIKFFR